MANNYNAYFYQHGGVLYFHIDKPSTAGAPAIPFTWDGPATEAQKGFYSNEYERFLKNNKAVTAEMTEAANTEME